MLGGIWRTLDALWSAIVASRLVFFLIALALLLLNSGQGEELTASLLVVPAYSNWLLFVSVFAWAGQSWLWARLAIELSLLPRARREASVPESYRIDTLLVEIVPVVYAFGVFLLAILQFIRSGKVGLVTLIGVCSLSLFACLFAWIYNYQKEVERTTQQISVGPRDLALRGEKVVRLLLDIDMGEQPRFPWWWIAVLTAYCWSIAWIVVGISYPLFLAKSIGTLGTVFLALSALIPLAGTAIIATRHANFPTLLLLILAPFILPAIYGWILEIPTWATWTTTASLAFITAVFVLRKRHFIAAILAALVLPLAYLAYAGPTVKLGIPHEVRRSAAPILECGSDAASPMVTNRNPRRCQSTIDQEIHAWLNGQGTVSPASSNYVVFVSAAGGGLRAGYWTASILARLNDCIEEFNQQLFAISGVSGGSLGAALYAALVRDSDDAAFRNKGIPRLRTVCDDHPLSVADVPMAKGWMQSQLQEILQSDFLAPVVANLFFSDLPQAIFPIQFMPDRAAALERTFEQAWHEACDNRNHGPPCKDHDQFKASFFNVRNTKGWSPLLLFNGTHQETGKRIVTSQLRIDQSSFYDAFDFFDLTDHDVALSTAVMNSARFPVISPAGALTKSRGKGVGEVELRGHIIDGGFFENNGAVTLEEVAAATLKRLALKTGDLRQAWRPLVIEIINDVEIGEEDLARPTNSLFQVDAGVPLSLRSGTKTRVPIANELFSAVGGLYATRTARGILASKMLAEFTRKNRGQYVQFRLCPYMNPSPPLGWLLTAQSRQAMDGLILGQSREDFQSKYASVLSAKGALGEYLKCFGEIQQRLSFVLKLLRKAPGDTSKSASQGNGRTETLR